MATKTYVCLDTNVLVRLVSQGKPGCEPEHWKTLQGHVKRSHVTLLVPEVVAMELENHIRTLENDYEIGYKLIADGLPKPPELWSEIEDAIPALLKHLEDIKREKIEHSKKRYAEVQGWLGSGHIMPLPLNSNVLSRHRKRIISGHIPIIPDSASSKNKSKVGDADCFIIESLAIYFESKGTNSRQLLLCTENVRDFGIEVEGKKTLHPEFRRGLPPTEIFTTLKSLVEFVESNKPVEEPAPEEVNKALDRERKFAVTLDFPSMYPRPVTPEQLVRIRAAMNPNSLESLIVRGNREETFSNIAGRLTDLAEHISEHWDMLIQLRLNEPALAESNQVEVSVVLERGIPEVIRDEVVRQAIILLEVKYIKLGWDGLFALRSGEYQLINKARPELVKRLHTDRGYKDGEPLILVLYKRERSKN